MANNNQNNQNDKNQNNNQNQDKKTKVAKYKALRTISVNGNIVNKGEVVELDEATAKAFGKDFVVPAKK